MAQARKDTLGNLYYDEVVSLTVTDATPDTIASTDVTLPEAFRNTPVMVVVPPLGIASTAFTLSYTAGTPKITISSSDVGSVSFGGKVIQVRLLACDQN